MKRLFLFGRRLLSRQGGVSMGNLSDEQIHFIAQGLMLEATELLDSGDQDAAMERISAVVIVSEYIDLRRALQMIATGQLVPAVPR
jgi:hypothetical protein